MVATTAVAQAVIFFDYAALGAMRTTLLYARASLGGGPMLVAALESALGVGQVGGALAVGRLSDRRGRRALLGLCLCCSACAYTLAGTALTTGSVALLLLSRAPAGISKQTTTTCRAIVCDCVPAAQRSSALSTLYACSALGYAVGPLVGGALAERSRQHVLAYASALTFAAITPAVRLALDETSPLAALHSPADTRATTPVTTRHTANGLPSGASAPRLPLSQAAVPAARPPYTGAAHGAQRTADGTRSAAAAVAGANGAAAARQRHGSVWQQPAMLRALLSISLPEAALVMHTAISQPLLARHLCLSPAAVGRLSATQGLAAALLSLGPLPVCFRRRYLDERRAILLGAALIATASTVVACRPTLLVVCCCLPPLALAVSLQRAASASAVSRAAPANAQGEALGALDTVSSLSRIVVPLVAGALAARGGPRWPYAAQAALGALGLLACLGGGIEPAGAVPLIVPRQRVREAEGARAPSVSLWRRGTDTRHTHSCVSPLLLPSRPKVE